MDCVRFGDITVSKIYALCGLLITGMVIFAVFYFVYSDYSMPTNESEQIQNQIKFEFINKTTNAPEVASGKEFVRYKNLTFEKNQRTLFGCKYTVKVIKEIWTVGNKTSIYDPASGNNSSNFRYAQNIVIKEPDSKNLIAYFIYGKSAYEEVWEVDLNKQDGYWKISEPVLVTSKEIDYSNSFEKLDYAKIVTDNIQFNKMVFLYYDNGSYKAESSVESANYG